MLGGGTIRSRKAKPGVTQTKNAMVILDPTSWRAVEIYKMHERDDLPRVASSSIGYEDIRIFRTARGGLQGIAASFHLQRSDRRDRYVEQVLLSFDENYDIVDAQPIRGDWSSVANKNWVPFDNCAEPRFLTSIAKGIVFDDRGELRARDAVVHPSTSKRSRREFEPEDRTRRRAIERAHETSRVPDDRSSGLPPCLVDVQMTGQEDLRGGTQLVRIGDDAWLGIGHSMRLIDKLKFYWHVWYAVDSRGTLKSVSPPMKLAPHNGIEFAAGMGIDGDRVVVSFGVDDGECRLGETKLSSVLEIMRPA